MTGYWRRDVGPGGAVVGIDTFGESAPPPARVTRFGFTVDNAVSAVRRAI